MSQVTGLSRRHWNLLSFAMAKTGSRRFVRESSVSRKVTGTIQLVVVISDFGFGGDGALPNNSFKPRPLRGSAAW